MSGLVDRIAAVLRAHYLWDAFGDEPEVQARCRCDVDDPHITNSVPDGGWMPFSEWAAHVAAAVAAELPELAELEATKLLLEATREQLSRTIADFCAVRDALPRKQVEQILSAVEDRL